MLGRAPAALGRRLLSCGVASSRVRWVVAAITTGRDASFRRPAQVLDRGLQVLTTTGTRSAATHGSAAADVHGDQRKSTVS